MQEIGEHKISNAWIYFFLVVKKRDYDPVRTVMNYREKKPKTNKQIN